MPWSPRGRPLAAPAPFRVSPRRPGGGSRPGRVCRRCRCRHAGRRGGHAIESTIATPDMQMVPHLITALKGPLLELERRILDATPRIERWFRLEWQEHTPPFYCSVDLRNAGFKLAPVDTNLYPGGFNNLSQ